MVLSHPFDTQQISKKSSLYSVTLYVVPDILTSIDAE